MSRETPNRATKASSRRMSAAAAFLRRYCGVPIVSLAQAGSRLSFDAGRWPFDPLPVADGVDVTKIGPVYGGSPGQGLGRGVAAADEAAAVDGVAGGALVAAPAGVAAGPDDGAAAADGGVTSPLALGDAANPVAASWGPRACRARSIAPAAEPASTRQIATTTNRGAVATSRPRRVRAVGGGLPSGVGIGDEPSGGPRHGRARARADRPR